MQNHVTLQPLSPESIPDAHMKFLRSVYASTRAGELALTNWNQAQKDAFLQMQFDAQHRYYLEHYPGAQFFLIEVDGVPAGRLYLHHSPQEIRIMDIALLPAFQRRGIGSGLLIDILDEGRRTARRVTIHVERFNPALALYRRLGFGMLDERGVYYFMGWSPETLPHQDQP